MNWGSLRPCHFFAEPVNHIYTQSLFDLKEYDKLYENQYNLDHAVWEEFDRKYKIGFEFQEDLDNINVKKEIICLWFFKERSDTTASYIDLGGKQLPYYPNTFLITDSKDIKFVMTKRKYIRHPFIQIDLSTDTWSSILKRINKLS